MAGGKETPRQKMIGMMYLVLTALLALNVSNSVLDKFVLINRGLEVSIEEKHKLNTATVDRVSKAVSESGSRPKDLAILEKAKSVREKSKESVELLERYKKFFIDQTGGIDENGSYVGKKDIETVSGYMVKEKKGDKLKEEVNSYSAFLRKTMLETVKISGDTVSLKHFEEEFHDIARDAKDIKGFREDTDQNRKTFAELQFGYNTPMVGALASVSQMQAEILNQETIALEEIARRVGAGDIKFDKIVAMVRPVSQTVASGGTYEAEMFIAASSSGLKPRMTVNDAEIPVVDGKGTVSFRAVATKFDDRGLSEKTYIASITVKRPGGRGDTSFVNPQTYYVAKPVIQIQSASVQALYLKCGNELSVQVPSLGNNYNPNFSVTGGRVIKGNKPGLITIVPNAKKVVLSLSNNGAFIGKRTFKVKRIPKPAIVVFVGSRKIGAKPIPAPRSLRIRAVPDESFEQFLPRDAKFRVVSATVTLVRGGSGVRTIRVTTEKANTAGLAAQARSGDLYVVEIKKVQRKNFRGKIENFSNYGPPHVTIRLK